MSGEQTLLELAARVEAATGPDRELDAEIAKALGLPNGKDSGWCNNENGDYWVVEECAAHVTASLDAAMTLVPEDFLLTGLAETIVECPQPWRAILWEKRRNTKKRPYGDGATPALALTAATLRAIDHQMRIKGND